MKNSSRKQWAARLPESTRALIKQISDSMGISQSEVVTRAVNVYAGRDPAPVDVRPVPVLEALSSHRLDKRTVEPKLKTTPTAHKTITCPVTGDTVPVKPPGPPSIDFSSVLAPKPLRANAISGPFTKDRQRHDT